MTRERPLAVTDPIAYEIRFEDDSLDTIYHDLGEAAGRAMELYLNGDGSDVLVYAVGSDKSRLAVFSARDEGDLEELWARFGPHCVCDGLGRVEALCLSLHEMGYGSRRGSAMIRRLTEGTTDLDANQYNAYVYRGRKKLGDRGNHSRSLTLTHARATMRGRSEIIRMSNKGCCLGKVPIEM